MDHPAPQRPMLCEMCMFGGPPKAVERVEGTNIFARALDDGRQLLVYSMNIAARDLG